MMRLIYKIRWIAFCLAASMLLHLLFMFAVRVFGSCDFGAPVNMNRGVVVELADASVNLDSARAEAKGSGTALKYPRATGGVLDGPPAAIREPVLSESEGESMSAVVAERIDQATTNGMVISGASPETSNPKMISDRALHPLQSSAFLPAKFEKLTYLVSMSAVPVGNAELEAVADDGQVTITFRIRSNELFSSLYPVDNLVETRHVDGRYIMTRIRQREGNFSNDAMFTINLLKKRVSWIDPLNGNSRQVNVPDDGLLDTLSGIYYLRNRNLVIGQTETLHIFDSETYAAVPVEILRREEIRLPNLTKVDTLVVRPLQKTAGMFRHSSELMIWLTNDSYKVPVKIVATIALGTVTAELLAAEAQ